MFRFLDKCMEDLDNPTQTFENFRLVTKIHAVQGLGVKDFVIIKGPKVVQKYFTNAFGPALSPEATTGWSNFLDLMIEVVTDTARASRIHTIHPIRERLAIYKTFQIMKHTRKKFFRNKASAAL